jgi:hypothetical protein
VISKCHCGDIAMFPGVCGWVNHRAIVFFPFTIYGWLQPCF